MPTTMIAVQNLSKIYKLGNIGTGTLSQDLNCWWSRTRGREDPLLELASPNDTAKKGSSDYIWSLKDINFEIEQGDVLGIIGKNGAGKSTLLKILSKITKPTTGKIHLNGRIASLLEVGTGFHPELTGRENVFLNGAILGMTKAEITRKFDEIVDFSGVERFIDTPVKRYSSGMYVRLAFAVAAHLEPEIFIIDEVLAVGDAEFQKKCLGKIKDVASGQGRTVLFVSHNVLSIKQLCTKVLFLENGMQKSIGSISHVLKQYGEKYLDTDKGQRGDIPFHLPGYFVMWRLESDYPERQHICNSREYCTFIFSFRVAESLHNCEFRFVLGDGETAMVNASSLDHKGLKFSLAPGSYDFKISLQVPLTNGDYAIQAFLMSMEKLVDIWYSTTRLTVLDNYELHVNDSILNIHTDFSFEQGNAETKLVSKVIPLAHYQNGQ